MVKRSTKLERDYQLGLIERIKELLPGCFVLKNDSSYRPGVPDWLILYGRTWAMLEVKKETTLPGSSKFQPNQEWYIDLLDQMSFSACIYPENEHVILSELVKHMEANK